MHTERIFDLALGTVVDRRIGLATPKEMPATVSPVSNWCLRLVTTATSPTLADFTLPQVRDYVAHLMGEHVRFAHHQNVRAGGRLSGYTINLQGRVRRAFAARLVQQQYAEFHELVRLTPLRPQMKPIVPPLTPENLRRLVAASRSQPAFGRAPSQAMLVSHRAGGTELALTAANRALHFESWRNPVVMNQATARTHHIGKAKGGDRDATGASGHG